MCDIVDGNCDIDRHESIYRPNCFWNENRCCYAPHHNFHGWYDPAKAEQHFGHNNPDGTWFNPLAAPSPLGPLLEECVAAWHVFYAAAAAPAVPAHPQALQYYAGVQPQAAPAAPAAAPAAGGRRPIRRPGTRRLVSMQRLLDQGKE